MYSLSFDLKLISNNHCVWDYNKSNNYYHNKINNKKLYVSDNYLLYKNKFLFIDFNNKVLLTNTNNKYVWEKQYKTTFLFINNFIYYLKSKLQIDFESNCKKLNITKNDINLLLTFKTTHNAYNACILLAAGLSTRFNSDVPKQLITLNNEPILLYLVKLFKKHIKYIIVITNDKISKQVKQLISNIKNVYIVINNINCRLASINTGLNFISENKLSINNVIIHDTARPFINSSHIVSLLKCNYYAQYCTNITNGLFESSHDDLNRDNYVQLCSPILINYNLALKIFNWFMNKYRITHEFIHIVKLLNINYTLLFDNDKFLKKITYKQDIE